MKNDRFLAGSLAWARARIPCSPLAGLRRIVAQYICGHRARRIMRTYHAVSQGRNWTRDAQPDAVNTEGTLIEDSHPATPRAVAAARRRRGTLAAGKRVLGPPPGAGGHSRSGREHPARQAIGGRACPCTPSEAAEVLTRGELTRLQAATSAALATYN
jgi:hypothetical protein